MIDAPSDLGPLAKNAFTAGDVLLLPVSVMAHAQEAVGATIKAARELHEQVGDALVPREVHAIVAERCAITVSWDRPEGPTYSRRCFEARCTLARAPSACMAPEHATR